MDIPGFTLLLQDFCAYCPDFEPELEKIEYSCEHPTARIISVA